MGYDVRLAIDVQCVLNTVVLSYVAMYIRSYKQIEIIMYLFRVATDRVFTISFISNLYFQFHIS